MIQSSNTFLVFDSTKLDVRCEICLHHKFLVHSYHTGADLNSLHTRVSLLRGDEWPYLDWSQAIHWWGQGKLSQEPPKCLESYKKIGGI